MHYSEINFHVNLISRIKIFGETLSILIFANTNFVIFWMDIFSKTMKSE